MKSYCTIPTRVPASLARSTTCQYRVAHDESAKRSVSFGPKSISAPGNGRPDSQRHCGRIARTIVLGTSSLWSRRRTECAVLVG